MIGITVKKSTITLIVRVAPKDYTAAIATMLRLLAERVKWTNSKSFGMYESVKNNETTILCESSAYCQVCL